MKPKFILYFSFAFAIAVIFSGVHFGLPLWLVDDEPPYILAALKMIQLKTVLPVLHLEAFRSFLYYPPYLSYFYLPIFIAILSVKYLFFSGTVEQFSYTISINPSIFFLAARLMIASLSLAGLVLFYKISLRLFENARVAVLAVFFLATSFSYLALSANSRHWLPVTFIFLLTLFFLSNQNFSFKKRYLLATTFLGLGVGVNVVSAVGVLFLPLWYLIYERQSLKSALTNPFVYSLIIIFSSLSVLPLIIFPSSLGFSGGVTLLGKSFMGLFTSPVNFLMPVIIVEPILFFWSLLGAIIAIKKRDRFLIFCIIFVILYSAIFYSLFYYTHRFVVPLLPLISALAAFGFNGLLQFLLLLDDRQIGVGLKYFFGILITTSLLFPVLISSRLAYLSFQNDSRILAREWVEKNLPADAKIITFSPRLRIASSRVSILEQKNIDPASLRKVDEAEAFFNGSLGNKYFNALNLYTVSDLIFFSYLPEYIKKQNVEYLVISSSEAEYINKTESIKKELPQYNKIVSFGSDLGVRQPGSEVFKWTWLDLFKIKEFGPKVEIYKI